MSKLFLWCDAQTTGVFARDAKCARGDWCGKGDKGIVHFFEGTDDSEGSFLKDGNILHLSNFLNSCPFNL